MNIDRDRAGTCYRVQIVAEVLDGDGPPPIITARVRIDSEREAQIVELSVVAPEGVNEVARSIDFDMLAQSLCSVVAATLPTGPPPGGDGGRARRAKPDRPYRRMPQADLVAGEFRRTGSVGKLAEHFDVPRYTAQAWVDRLRRSGVLETSAR
ncbi:hypothetical protein [Micromonospora sp. NPDC051141]|uniref:hypothetical protein n=1 Tax=Micromonospora sp. NPDC051141 TaxID=3364284 RepID=UPI0037AD5D03